MWQKKGTKALGNHHKLYINALNQDNGLVMGVEYIKVDVEQFIKDNPDIQERRALALANTMEIGFSPFRRGLS